MTRIRATGGRGGTPWDACRGAAALLALLLVSGGCLLTAPPPSDDVVVNCFVTVRNPQVTPEVGDAELEESLSNVTDPFLTADQTPVRRYSVAGTGDGCEGVAFPSVAAANQDWDLFVVDHIQKLAEQGDDENVFGRFAEQVDGWCAVEGTSLCTTTPEVLAYCEEPPLAPVTSAEPLPTCPPPPVEECLAIECDGEGGCTNLAFGEVGIGASASRQVTVSNCAEEGGPAIDVAVDTIDPLEVLGADNPFTLAELPADDPGANTCHPMFGDTESVTLDAGASCGFTVVFAPLDPGAQTAEVRGLDLTLSGTGVGGELAFEDLQTGEALECGGQESSICVDDDAAPCTDERLVRVTNVGLGGAEIEAVRIQSQDDDNPGFTVEPQIPPADPVALGAGESLDLDVRWCEAPGAQEQGRLILDWNAPVGDPCQTLSVRLRRPPCQ